MKTHDNLDKKSPRALDSNPRASRQASVDKILQKYAAKNNVVQCVPFPDEDELVSDRTELASYMNPKLTLLHEENPKREIYAPDPFEKSKEMERKAREYFEEYIAEYGIDPVTHKILLAQERGERDDYTPAPKMTADDYINYCKALHQLQFEKEYLEDTVHGGFEKRASSVVSHVKRERPSQIINYGEITRHSEVEGDWILIDYEKFGPHTSGGFKKDFNKQGPYITANPDCADPRVQDDIHDWLIMQREGDQENGRTEDRVDVQFYDDKLPCETCEVNIPAQVENEKFNLDLFLAERQDIPNGKYSGAKFQNEFHPTASKLMVPLATRGRGQTKTEFIAAIDFDIANLNKQKESKEQEINRITAKESKIPKKNQPQAIKKVQNEIDSIIYRINQLQQRRGKAVNNWPDIQKS